MNGEVGRADAFDLRAHRRQQAAQVDNLRFARGISQPGNTAGQYCRHQRIFGRSNGDDGEIERPAGQSAVGRAGTDIAGGHLDFRADRFQRFQMEVDRAIADRAAAGQRYGRFTRPARAAGRAPGSKRASCAPDRMARR